MTRHRPLRRAALAVALALAAPAALAAPTAAQEPTGFGVGGDGVPSFSVSPRQASGTAARSYFSFHRGAGEVRRDAVRVTNNGTTPVTLQVSASRGITAVGSGIAFDHAFVPCAGTGCWVTGLPASVSLAAGASQTLPFTVTVPPDTPLKQYLAGITVQPLEAPDPTRLGGDGTARAQARIVNQVTVGVAVTVGALPQLSKELAIPEVEGALAGTTPQLHVHERNGGQTFVRGEGRGTCTDDGREVRFPVVSDTVLPGDPATLTTSATGLRPGTTVPCSIGLPYGRGKVATWEGMVTIPEVAPGTSVPTGQGAFSRLLPDDGMPWWAYVLVGLGIVVIVLLLVVVVLMLRRRHGGGGPGGPGPSGPEGSDRPDGGDAPDAPAGEAPTPVGTA